MDLYDAIVEEALSINFVNEKMEVIDKLYDFISTLEFDVKRRKQAIEDLKELNKSCENKIDNIKKALSDKMTLNGFKKVEGQLHRLSLRKSTYVAVYDETKLEDKYFKEKTTRSVDKVTLGEQLKLGLDIEGARLMDKQNLQMK